MCEDKERCEKNEEAPILYYGPGTTGRNIATIKRDSIRGGYPSTVQCWDLCEAAKEDKKPAGKRSAKGKDKK